MIWTSDRVADLLERSTALRQQLNRAENEQQVQVALLAEANHSPLDDPGQTEVEV